MKLTKGAYAMAIGFALVGCSHEPEDKFVAKPPEAVPPATLTPGNETALLPLDKGNQWTYTVELVTGAAGAQSAQQNYESVWSVTDSKQTTDGIEATIETTVPSGKKDVQEWRANSTGIYEVGEGSPPVKFTPPMPVMLFPVKEGSTFQWSGTGPNGTLAAGHQTSHSTILGSQDTDTDMGRMSAYAVESHSSFESKQGKGTSDSTIWMSPGVGIVRLRQEVHLGDKGYVLLIKLKSKSLMKS